MTTGPDIDASNDFRAVVAAITANRDGIEDALHNGRGMTKANRCWEDILNSVGLSHLTESGRL